MKKLIFILLAFAFALPQAHSTLTKDTVSIAVTAEADVDSTAAEESINILDQDTLITSVAFTSGGTTVTLTNAANVVTISDGSNSTTIADTNFTGIAATVIAYLAL